MSVPGRALQSHHRGWLIALQLGWGWGEEAKVTQRLSCVSLQIEDTSTFITLFPMCLRGAMEGDTEESSAPPTNPHLRVPLLLVDGPLPKSLLQVHPQLALGRLPGWPLVRRTLIGKGSTQSALAEVGLAHPRLCAPCYCPWDCALLGHGPGAHS